jgi:GAF domain-containing protein
MARSSRTDDKRSAAKKRKAGTVKSRKRMPRQKALIAERSSKKPSRTKSSITALQKELERQARELEETRQQQAASSEVLQIISSSAGALKPVFQAITKSAVDLCKARFGAVFRMEGNLLHLVTDYNFEASQRQLLGAMYPMKPSRGHISGRAILARSTVQIPDIYADVDYKSVEAKKAGFRSLLAAPLLQRGQAIGSIVIYRTEPGVFTAQQSALLQNFAAQAVIAIENARLFNETKAALERQTASAEVLQVISSSPGELKPVFDQMLAKAMRLCEAQCGFIYQMELGAMRAVAEIGVPPAFTEYRRNNLHTGGAATPVEVMRATRKPAHVHDARDSEPYRSGNPNAVAGVDLGGARTVLYVPMIRNDDIVGVINVYRQEVRPFTEEQISLLENFASQAVIAIENARLFNETQEALERQTATADVLNVIGRSPTDAAPVFDVIGERAEKLCNAEISVVSVLDGDLIKLAGIRGISNLGVELFRAQFPLRLDRQTVTSRTIRSGTIVHVGDVLADSTYDNKTLAAQTGYRSCLGVPMHNKGRVVGAIFVARTEPGPFSDNQIQLLQVFADQAVIAIENVRLFNETKEALARQTATSDVLKVIASSPSDLQPVFNAIAERSNELMDGHATTVFRFVGETAELAAFTSVSPEADAVLREAFPRPIANLRDFEKISRGQIAETIDAAADTEPESSRNIARARGFRSRLVVPLKSDSGVIGAISITRKQPGAFAPRDVELVRTFADQAVIAIQNVKLFEEVQAKTRDLSEALTYQTGSGNILKVIASSPTNAGPVLETIADNACEVCEAYDATVVLRDDDHLRVSAHCGPIPLGRERWPNDPTSISGRAIADLATVHLRDVLSDECAEFPAAQEMCRRDGVGTMLAAPMLREGEAIGTIVLRRTEVNPFTDKQIAALQTFADQAVIAIGNVRLFEEVQARTRELTQSLDDLRAAQDRLIQTEKLASLGQLTAGIAHEIKNPLNFVNNFSALSAELTDELNDVLKPVAMDGKVRVEVDELTGLLKENLEKVVQHGKRADSIVKNMLLHSRSGSGEHRPVEINAIVEESLNLAYHGARAEGQDFIITLERDFDQAGVADIYPQEITRVLLNLISNGLYSATRRAAVSGNGFEPKLRAATRNLGEQVEIRIRDNGMGIPDDIREKIFNPFFTTKPAGEGTGLGLSMSHDIVVKQHGGRIDVVTEPGSFTEFVVTLPRVMPAQDAGGRRK